MPSGLRPSAAHEFRVALVNVKHRIDHPVGYADRQKGLVGFLIREKFLRMF